MKRLALNAFLPVIVMTLTSFPDSVCRSQTQNERVVQRVDRFPAGKGFVEIPFELERDRAVILVNVNNSDPLKFLVDTGSQTPNLRGAAPAESLGLKIIGVAKVGGAGSGTATRAEIAGDVMFNLSGATLKVAEMVVPPLPDPARPPLSVFGVIGRPLFEAFVVEFDWEKQIIRLYDPAKYSYSGKGAVLPLTFDESGLPYTTAAVDVTGGSQIPVKLLVDTGANFSLGLDVGSRPDIRLPVRSLATVVGEGAQGQVTGHIGRVESLRLGSYVFKNVYVDFAAASNPFVGTADSQGLIGTQVLKRFRVIFDYSRKQMILERNRFFREPFDGYTTGFSYTRIHTAPKVLKLTGIFERSAAKDAGLLAGDEIVKINGRGVSMFTDDDLYRLFQKRGVQIRLEIQRSGEQLEKRIKLRRFV